MGDERGKGHESILKGHLTLYLSLPGFSVTALDR